MAGLFDLFNLWSGVQTVFWSNSADVQKRLSDHAPSKCLHC
jgi:hypothetical protein